MASGVVVRVALLLLLATLAIVACGKRGPPTAPGPAAEVIYPKQQYPAR